MTSNFSRAAKINNEAILALQQGDEQIAITCFKASLGLLKKELYKEQASGMNQPSFGGKLYEACTVKISHSDESDDSAGFYHAITMPLSASIQNEKSYSLHLHVYSAAVVFNLAMTHHHLANNGTASCILKAEKLYSSALKILDNASFQMRTAFLIKLASINNLATLCVANGDYEMASEGLSHISECLVNSNDSLLHEPEVEALLRNILFIRIPQVAPAA